MFLGGDEQNRTQLGNNNAYCHDTNWNYLNWEPHEQLSHWISQLVSLRKLMTEITGEAFYGDDDVDWLTEGAAKIESGDWNNNESRPLILRVRSKQNQRDLILAFNPTMREVSLGFSSLELIIASGPTSYKSPYILMNQSFAAFRLNSLDSVNI